MTVDPIPSLASGGFEFTVVVHIALSDAGQPAHPVIACCSPNFPGWKRSSDTRRTAGSGTEHHSGYNCALCTNRSYRPSITIRLTCWSHSREPTPILPPLSPSPLHRTDPHLGAGVELVRKAVPVVSGLPRCCSTTLSSSPFIARRYPWVVGLDPWVLMTHSAFSEDRQLILLRQSFLWVLLHKSLNQV